MKYYLSVFRINSQLGAFVSFKHYVEIRCFLAFTETMACF